MPDIVTECMDDLSAKVDSVDAVTNKVLYVYNQKDLLDVKKKLRYPCVGTIYIGLTQNPTSDRRQDTMVLAAEVVLLGADACKSTINGEIQGVTQILDTIRTTVMANPATALEKKWFLQSEIPIEVKTEKGGILGYVQRWTTIINL